MNVIAEDANAGDVRCRVFSPAGATRRWPAVVAWSDIFQLTLPHVRFCARLASHGFLVVAPELYGRFEPKGTALRFEEERQRALDDSLKLELAWIDADIAAALDLARGHPRADATRLATVGFCFGGHVALRAALSPDVRAAACFYPTGLHTDTLGAAQGTARTLAEATRLRARLLLVWGTRDPHIPAEGRHRIHAALAAAGVSFDVHHFDAEHAFLRDEGPRWDPAAADEAFGVLLGHLAR